MENDVSQRWVALLRGVNVGGVKVLMEPLRGLAQGLGWQGVESYIASGNLVFSAQGKAEDLAGELRAAMVQEMGVETPVLVLSAQDICAVRDQHPWQPEKGNQAHVYFCWDRPEIDAALYEALRAGGEELRIVGNHVHFLAPEGLGRSKLAEKLGRVIRGTEITGRNLNTVRKLADMVAGAPRGAR